MSAGRFYRLIVAALAERTRPKSIEIGNYFEVKLASVVRDVEVRVEVVAHEHAGPRYSMIARGHTARATTR